MQKPVLHAVFVVLLLVGFLSSGSRVTAQGEEPVQYDAIYFPWVPNGDTIDGTGPWQGSITIQNIDVEVQNLGVRIWVFDSQTINQIASNDDGTGEHYSLEDALADSNVPHFDLDPNASVTLSAGEIGIQEPGSAVAVLAIYKTVLDNPEQANDYDAPTIAGVQKQSLGEPMFNARTTDGHSTVDGYTAIPFEDIAWGSQSDFCHAISDGVNSCDGSGYYTDPYRGGLGFDGHSYLPIVQTNSNWNTELYLSNVDLTGVTAAQVNVTLITTDQQGYGASAEYKLTETFNIPPGQTYRMNVADWIGPDWIGSAHITSTVGVAAMAVRSNRSAEMQMINTSAPSLRQKVDGDAAYLAIDDGNYEQFAPLLFQEYNGWSTGFSFVNIAEETNRVNATFYDADGNMVGQDQRTISPQGQEFIHVPAKSDLGLGRGEGFVGSAVFTSDLPFHVAVDQVKYATGEAMSYLATASGASYDSVEWPADGYDGILTLPLVQKGLITGSGDVSGLQLFNASLASTVEFDVTFYDSAGAAVPPTKNSPFRMTLGQGQNATIYTMDLSEMAQNQRSSAVIVPVTGEGQLVGVSNNVNYTVSGDGAVAFNAVNINGQYRFPVPGFEYNQPQ